MQGHGDGDDPRADTARTTPLSPPTWWIQENLWVEEIEINRTDGTVTDTGTTGTGTRARTRGRRRARTGPESLTTATTPQTGAMASFDSDPIEQPGNFTDDRNIDHLGVWTEESLPEFFDDFLEEDRSRPCG